jgi:hypothetical protein
MPATQTPVDLESPSSELPRHAAYYIASTNLPEYQFARDTARHRILDLKRHRGIRQKIAYYVQLFAVHASI